MKNQIKQECESMSNDCGGFRHCSNREFDKNRKECLECLEDAMEGIEESMIYIKEYYNEPTL